MGTRLVSHRWLRDSKRGLEDVAVSWVIADLQAEGLSIGDIWRPEREPNRRPELRRRPDCALTINDQPAAIEATLFTTTAEAAGAARAEVVKTLLESRLNEAGLGIAVLGVAVYEPASIRRAGTNSDLQRDAEELVELIATHVRTVGEATAVRLGGPRPAWLRSLSITTTTQLAPKVEILFMAPRDRVARQAVQFFAERAAGKGDQHEGWGLGILSIIHGLYEKPDDLRVALAARDAWPWWRVYWIDRGPPPVRVWP
jgi:hypothetical protein